MKQCLSHHLWANAQAPRESKTCHNFCWKMIKRISNKTMNFWCSHKMKRKTLWFRDARAKALPRMIPINQSWPSNARPSDKRLHKISLNSNQKSLRHSRPVPSVNKKKSSATGKWKERLAHLKIKASRSCRLVSISKNAKRKLQSFRSVWTRYLTVRTNFGNDFASRKTPMMLGSDLASRDSTA